MNEWGGGDDVDSLRVRVVLLKALFIEETGEVRGCMWCCTLWATEEDGIISICVLDKACLSCALGDYCNVEPAACISKSKSNLLARSKLESRFVR